MINKFRWWMVKKISPWLWKLTPEPHRTNLRKSMTYDKELWK